VRQFSAQVEGSIEKISNSVVPMSALDHDQTGFDARQTPGA
jgi:hypothetical protein